MPARNRTRARKPGADRRGDARPKGDERLVGVQPVREALRAGRRKLVRLSIQQGPAHAGIEELRALAAAAAVEVREVPSLGLPDTLNAQRVLLEAGPLPRLLLRDLLADAPADAVFVATDGVEDPQNLGAIARVAEGAGVAGLLLPERRAAPLSEVVSRASAGAIEWLPVASVGNLTRSLIVLREAGYWIAGTDSESGTDLFEVPDRLLTGRLVVVLGSEGRGLREGVKKLVDHPLRIPMRGRIDSLNVATAAAVVLYEIDRRRSAESKRT